MVINDVECVSSERVSRRNRCVGGSPDLPLGHPNRRAPRTLRADSISIDFKYTPKYPDELPQFHVAASLALTPDQNNRVTEVMGKEAEEEIGTVMIFTMVQAVRATRSLPIVGVETTHRALASGSNLTSVSHPAVWRTGQGLAQRTVRRAA